MVLPKCYVHSIGVAPNGPDRTNLNLDVRTTKSWRARVVLVGKSSVSFGWRRLVAGSADHLPFPEAEHPAAGGPDHGVVDAAQTPSPSEDLQWGPKAAHELPVGQLQDALSHLIVEDRSGSRREFRGAPDAILGQRHAVRRGRQGSRRQCGAPGAAAHQGDHRRPDHGHQAAAPQRAWRPGLGHGAFSLVLVRARRRSAQLRVGGRLS